ncbi:MAG: PAS domain S-box protein [Candidatus Thorarchaeota archaeon]
MPIRVLMVDDDAVHLELSKQFLTRQSQEYDIVTAESYDEALTLLETGQFDVAVCDIDLAERGKTGLDILESLRSEGKETPVIIFTGKSREDFAIQALNLGADYYIRKSSTDIEKLYAELSYYILTAVEKQITKEALRESEIRAQTYLDTAGTVIIAFDSDLNITMANKMACEVLEYSEEELIGKNWIETFIKEEDREKIGRYLHELLAGRVNPDWQEEWPIITKSGREKIIEWTDNVLRDAHGNVIGIISAGPEVTEKKKAEALLKTERDRAQKYLDLADTALLAFDTSFRVTMVNEKACDLLGFDEDDIVGCDWVDSFIPNDYKRDAIEYLQELVQNPRESGSSCVLNVRTRGGVEKRIKCYDQVLMDDEGRVTSILCSARETAPGEATLERMLGTGEDIFRTIFDESPICIEFFDADGRLISANKATLDLFGVSDISDLLGFDLFSDPNVPEHVKSKLRAGEIIREEVRFDFSRVRVHNLYKTERTGVKHLDSVFSPLRTHGKLTGYIAHIRDVTEKRIVEKALRESRENYKELYSNALTGLFRVRMSDGLVLDCNDQFASIVGFESPTEVVDEKNYFKNILTQPSVWDLLKRTLREEEKTVVEARVSRKDSSRVWVRLSLRGIPEKGYIEGVMTDITQEKEAMEMLKRQKRELSDFAHSMAHDLKNIFNNMLGYAELAEDENDLRHLKKLKMLIRDAGALIDHSVMLADAGLIVDDTAGVNLDEVIRSVAQAVVPEDVEYRQDALPSVTADANKVAQIFRNLLDNAVRHGQPENIRVTHREDENEHIIEVCNDGKKIPSSVRAGVFSDGFSHHGRGRGFGLALVKRLTEAHGWRIELGDSRVTTFRVHIPKQTE